MIHRQRWTSEKIKKRLELIAPLVYRRQSGIPSFHYFALEGPADPNTADTIFTMQDEEVLWLKAQIDQIGPVIRTKGYGVHVNWGPGGWFTQNEFAGGGAMADMGIHALDTARFLLGDPLPVSVYAQIGTYHRDFDVDDTGVILVNWDNGVTSYIESGWWQPRSDGPEAGTQLYGTQGFASLFPTYLSLPNAFEERGGKRLCASAPGAVSSEHV